MIARRTAAALVAGALLVAPVAGCGGSSTKPDASASSLGPGELAPKAFVADLLAHSFFAQRFELIRRQRIQQLRVDLGFHPEPSVGYIARTRNRARGHWFL